MVYISEYETTRIVRFSDDVAFERAKKVEAQILKQVAIPPEQLEGKPISGIALQMKMIVSDAIPPNEVHLVGADGKRVRIVDVGEET